MFVIHDRKQVINQQRYARMGDQDIFDLLQMTILHMWSPLRLGVFLTRVLASFFFLFIHKLCMQQALARLLYFNDPFCMKQLKLII